MTYERIFPTIAKIGRFATMVVAMVVAANTERPTIGAEPEVVGSPIEAAIERVRREIRMLDDIYKGGVVVITQNYVNDKDSIPAGTAFKQLFEAAEKQGWHRVRLVDVTGDPYSDENVAEDAFEKNAVKSLQGGDTWVEAIEEREGTRHLRVATPIPVVFDKCVMCHENYANVPKGQAIGALTYVVPIDGPLVAKVAVPK